MSSYINLTDTPALFVNASIGITTWIDCSDEYYDGYQAVNVLHGCESNKYCQFLKFSLVDLF